ncbi:MAG: 50S ribosomal protein L29 [Deltaproteobacteria bacterium]|nr:MAG: 50S ribosomal protein L29 [Deltaproteobacteria bacterium]
MKADQLRELTPEELIQREQDLKDELFNLRFQHFTGQLDKTSRLTEVRREIARIKTIRTERNI